MTPTNEVIPVMTAHNDLIARVLDRHGIQQLTLADECQLSESVISRVISGQRVVSPEIFRALYKLTGDFELITFLVGTNEFAIIKHIYTDLPLEQVESMAVRGLAKILSSNGIKATNDQSRFERVTAIDQLVQTLMTLRAKFAAPNTGKPKRTAYRPVHRPPVGGQLDAIA